MGEYLTFFINIEMDLMTSKDLFQVYQSLAQDLSHLKKNWAGNPCWVNLSHFQCKKTLKVKSSTSHTFSATLPGEPSKPSQSKSIFSAPLLKLLNGLREIPLL